VRAEISATLSQYDPTRKLRQLQRNKIKSGNGDSTSGYCGY